MTTQNTLKALIQKINGISPIDVHTHLKKLHFHDSTWLCCHPTSKSFGMTYGCNTSKTKSVNNSQLYFRRLN